MGVDGMNFQDGFNLVVMALAALFGWMLNVLYTTMRDLQNADKELTEKVQRVEVLVAGNYPTRGEFDSKIDALFRKLDTIEDKIDKKADK